MIIDSIMYMIAELPMDSDSRPIADRKTLEFLNQPLKDSGSGTETG
jgi:hypothetical protein